MEKETYLKDIILKSLVNDILDNLDYNPCNSDWEFSTKDYEKTIETLLELILEEQPIMPFTFIRDYLKWN